MNIESIKHIQSLGFNVYMRDTGDSWMIYERNGELGYYENGRSGCRIATVHKPNRRTGTGFVSVEFTHDKPSIVELEAGLRFAPGWASRADRDSVVKYSGIDQYRSKSEWNAAYKLIETTLEK